MRLIVSTKHCDICVPNLTKRKRNFPEQTPDLSTIWSHLKIPEIRMSEIGFFGVKHLKKPVFLEEEPPKSLCFWSFALALRYYGGDKYEQKRR